MFRSYWFKIIAIVGLALISGLALAEQSPTALEGDPITSARQDERATTSDDSGETEDNNAVDISPFLKGIETAIGNIVPSENENERQGQQEREIRDLDAQEGMVVWAKGMFWVTIATVFLTFAALVAIIVTLGHTKRAADSAEEMVDEAKKTTKAAFDTVTVTREMGEIQARAYVGIKSLIFEPGKPVRQDKWTVRPSIKNFGQSLAEDAVMFTGKSISSDDTSTVDFLSLDNGHLQYIGTIAPQNGQRGLGVEIDVSDFQNKPRVSVKSMCSVLLSTHPWGNAVSQDSAIRSSPRMTILSKAA